MRNTYPLMIAIALVAAAPATAQGTDNSMNADDVATTTTTTTTTNDTTGNVAADSMAAANDMTAVPMDQPVETTTEPAPAKPASFPWGVLGLLGLVGLLGRKRA